MLRLFNSKPVIKVNYHRRHGFRVGIKCPRCNRQFTILDNRPHEYIDDRRYAVFRCPECKVSYNISYVYPRSDRQEVVQAIIEKNCPGIKDEIYWEYWNKDWAEGKEDDNFRLDMYLPKEKIAVEYDGNQHIWGNDRHKDKILGENGIHVIRIRHRKEKRLTDNRYRQVFYFSNLKEEEQAIENAIKEINKARSIENDKPIEVNIRETEKSIKNREGIKRVLLQAIPFNAGLIIGGSVVLLSLNKKPKRYDRKSNK